MPSRSGCLQQQRLGDFLRPGRIGQALLGDDLHVRVVDLNGRLEGVVTLIGDVILGVVEYPGDLALPAQSFGQHVGRLLAHLEQIVGDDRDVVLAVNEILRLI